MNSQPEPQGELKACEWFLSGGNGVITLCETGSSEPIGWFRSSERATAESIVRRHNATRASVSTEEAGEIDEYHALSDHNAVTRTWAALGIASYTGKSVDEHVAELKAERDAIAAELAALRTPTVEECHHLPNWLWCGRCHAWIETQHQCGAQYIDRGTHFEEVQPAAPVPDGGDDNGELSTSIITAVGDRKSGEVGETKLMAINNQIAARLDK